MQIVLLVTDLLETRSYAEKELILNLYRVQTTPFQTYLEMFKTLFPQEKKKKIVGESEAKSGKQNKTAQSSVEYMALEKNLKLGKLSVI